MQALPSGSSGRSFINCCSSRVGLGPPIRSWWGRAPPYNPDHAAVSVYLYCLAGLDNLRSASNIDHGGYAGRADRDIICPESEIMLFYFLPDRLGHWCLNNCLPESGKEFFLCLGFGFCEFIHGGF